jgi:hypothetical protein
VTAARPHSQALSARPVRRAGFKVNFPGIPVDVLAYRCSALTVRPGQELWRFKVCWRTPDSHGTGLAYSGVTDEWWLSPVTREKIAKYAALALVRSFEHEVRELLTIDGRRAFPDPHAKKKRRSAGVKP